jgi:hypothetical protein
MGGQIMKQERRAYEWSILYYYEGYDDADPIFEDSLRRLLGGGVNHPFLKERKFTNVKQCKDPEYGKQLYGDLEIKLWRWDFGLGEWDNDYSKIEDGTGKILPSDYYDWKVPKKYQVELDRLLKRSK